MMPASASGSLMAVPVLWRHTLHSVCIGQPCWLFRWVFLMLVLETWRKKVILISELCPSKERSLDCLEQDYFCHCFTFCYLRRKIWALELHPLLLITGTEHHGSRSVWQKCSSLPDRQEGEKKGNLKIVCVCEYLHVSVCVCSCRYLHVSAVPTEASRWCQIPWARATVSCLMWVIGTKLKSGTHFQHWAVSPAPRTFFLKQDFIFLL